MSGVVAVLLSALVPTLALGRPSAIPELDLERLDPQVREQLATARTTLERTLEELSMAAEPMAPDANPITVLVDTGKLYLAYDYVEAGLACLELAATNSTGLDAESEYLRGYALERSGQRSAAIDAYTGVLEQQPGQAVARLRLANQLLELDRTDDARSHYQQAFDDDRSCVGALYGLGELARRDRDDAAAARYFEQALDIAPNATQLRYSLGLTLRRLGRVDEARELLESADWKQLNFGGWLGCSDPLVAGLMELTTGVSAHILRAGQASFKGLPEVEVAEYQRATVANPNDAVAWANYGAAVYRQDDFDGATTAYRRAIELDPDNPSYRSDLGTILIESGSQAEGVASLRQAISLDPRHLNSLLALVEIELAAGRFAEVVAHCRQIVAVDPLQRQARVQLAMALFRLGRRADAVVELGTLMDIHPPDDPNERMQLATMLAGLGDPNRALEHFATIRDTSTDPAIRAQAMTRIGQTRLQLGQIDQAISSLEAAVALQPQLAEASAALAQARQLKQRGGR